MIDELDVNEAEDNCMTTDDGNENKTESDNSGMLIDDII